MVVAPYSAGESAQCLTPYPDRTIGYQPVDIEGWLDGRQEIRSLLHNCENTNDEIQYYSH